MNGTSARCSSTSSGIELKPSYWRTAVGNLRRTDAEMSVPSLFDDVDGAS